MKVALVSPFPPDVGGIAIYSNNLLRELKQSAKVITIGNKNSDADYKIDLSSLALKKEIEKIVEKEKVDVVHFQYNAGLYGKKSLNLNFINALQQKVPSLATLHEVQYESNSIKQKLLCWLEKRIIQNASKIIVHTQKQKDFLENKYKAKNILRIYHGLELYPISGKKGKNILFFGLISDEKGLAHLIKAMKFLPDFNLRIVGNPVNRKIEQELLKELKNSKNIVWKFGWVTDEERWDSYAKANIVVLPYLWAPYQSGVLHNSVSAGLPVVVTSAGALPEIVERFKIGEIVRPADEKALVEGIVKVYNNYDTYKRGIHEYRKEANWGTVAKEHIKAYESLQK